MSIGQLTKHRTLGMSDQQAIDLYECMLLARKFDERATVLQRAGKIAFHVSGIGQEAAQAAAAFALDRESDYFLPYYRDFAFVLGIGMTVRDLLLASFMKAEDPSSGGRQMQGHFSSKRLRIVTGSSPVSTQAAHAAGFALSAQMRGEQAVAFTTYGEGSSNQGDVHEACNFAGVCKLPVIFMCENNRYAISTPLHKQVSGNIYERAIGYGFPGYRVDGNDPLEVYRVVKEARERALRGEGPTMIETMVYRLSPHSTSDDDMLYRTKEEVEEFRKLDGLFRYKAYLIDCGIWDETRDAELHAKQQAEIIEATNYSDKAPYPAPEHTLLHLFAETKGEG